MVSVTGGALSSVYAQSTGALTLNSAKTLTLKAGTYCFGNVNLSGGAQLNTSGSGVTAIYIDGILHVQNNGTMINNASQDPQNVQLIVTFGNDAGETNGQCGGNPVCLESGAVMYMTVYAPSTGVKLQGGGDIYGAIVGNTIDVTGNVTVHYDNYLINSPNLVKGIPTQMTTTTTTTTTYTTWTPAAYSVANWLKAKCKQSSLSSPWSCS